MMSASSWRLSVALSRSLIFWSNKGREILKPEAFRTITWFRAHVFIEGLTSLDVHQDLDEFLDRQAADRVGREVETLDDLQESPEVPLGDEQVTADLVLALGVVDPDVAGLEELGAADLAQLLDRHSSGDQGLLGGGADRVAEGEPQVVESVGDLVGLLS